MKAKISKAQLEVWECKERLSKELMSVPENKRVDYILNKVKKTVERIKKKKKKFLA